METKEFDIGDVISAGTGYLVSRRHIEGVYDVLNWMTGESLMTHQLPRVCREAKPVLQKHFPWFGIVEVEAENVTPENHRRWLEKWESEYGLRVSVPKMTADDHERIDPMSELAEKVHPDKIVTINI